MNSIGRPFHFSPPPQPAPEPALPVTPTVDHTARIRNTLTAQTASFLEPLDVAHFAQTSRHNYQGSALLVKARLQHQFRDAQPFAQFGIPKRRLDTAVPLDRTGMAYLASLEITGPLAIELIKSGTCSIQEIERRSSEIDATISCPDVPDESVLENLTVFDYLVAECLTCDQALDLSDQLTDDAIEILDDEMVRLCIFRGYLPFERALMLTDDDVNILNTDTVRELLKDKQPVNIDLLLTRRLIATSLYGFGTPASRNNLARLLTGLNNFALARNWLNVVTALTLETYQSGLSGSSGSDNSPDSTMDDLD